jgi:hypothetical protein
MNLVENPVIFFGPIIGQGAGATLKPFAPILRVGQGSYLDFDFLTGRESGILGQLDCPAVDSAVKDFGHLVSFRPPIWTTHRIILSAESTVTSQEFNR